MAHIIQPPPKASEVCAEVSPLLDAPLLRMLDKNPTERPASAGEAILALRRAASQSGVEVDDAPLHLSRPEPTISGEQLRGEPDTLLDEPEELRSAAPSTVSANGSPRPLWPFGVGLLLMAALLGFVVLRGPAAAPAPDGAFSIAVPAPPPLATPAPPAAASAQAEPAVSADVPLAKSATVAPPRASDAKKAKVRPSASAYIPTDLENPF
jgi:hypothetical protein